MVTMAYRTVSYEAVWLGSGVEPLELKVEWKLAVQADVTQGVEERESGK